jgi:hypothetical protein
MAVTINTPLYPATPPGNHRLAIASFTGDSSYPTGGYPVTLSAWGFSNYLDHTEIGFALGSSLSYIVKYNASTGKLQWFTASSSGIVEVTNATDLHTYTVGVTAFGV